MNIDKQISEISTMKFGPSWSQPWEKVNLPEQGKLWNEENFLAQAAVLFKHIKTE